MKIGKKLAREQPCSQREGSNLRGQTGREGACARPDLEPNVMSCQLCLCPMHSLTKRPSPLDKADTLCRHSLSYMQQLARHVGCNTSSISTMVMVACHQSRSYTHDTCTGLSCVY